jgi:hypothetical protein
VIRYRATRANRLLDGILPLPEADWNADWRVRLPASAILGAARVAAQLPVARRAPHDFAAVLAFYHLGDQLRMLNVLSRFPLDAIVVHTNAEAAAPLALYANIRAGKTFASHGLFSFLASTRGVTRVERMLVPHPTMTMPSALAFARRAAAHTIVASTGEYDLPRSNIDIVLADRASWRRFYESFFEDALGLQPVRATPNVLPAYRYAASNSRRVFCHLTAGLAERRMPVASARAVVARIAGAGFTPVLLGVAAERDALHAMAGTTSAEFCIGKPLPEVAAQLARAHAFVGLESSMGHLADAVGLPSVVMYSATRPHEQGPFYTRSIGVAVARATIDAVAVLTGRLPLPDCDWRDIDARVLAALGDLSNERAKARAG